MRRLLFDQWSARITEAKELGRFVEGFADGVVERAAKAEIVADAAHAEYLRMAAGREEKAVREWGCVGESRGQRVRLQMVHRHQWLAVHERDRLGHGQADDDAADQARPGGRGDTVEGGERDPRLVHCLGDDGIECLDMGAGGNFRYYAAKLGVFADLRKDDVRQNAALSVNSSLHYGGGRFVAGRFDAQDDHRRIMT